MFSACPTCTHAKKIKNKTNALKVNNADKSGHRQKSRRCLVHKTTCIYIMYMCTHQAPNSFATVWCPLRCVRVSILLCETAVFFFIYQKEKIATKHMLDHRNLQFPRYWNKRWQIVFQYTMNTARSTGSEEPLQQHSTNDGNTTVEKTRTNLNSNTKQLMHTKAALCQKLIQMNRWTNTCTTGFIWASCSNHWFYKHMHMKQRKSSKTYCMPNVSDQTVQPCRHIHLMLIQPLRCKELEKNFCT